MIGLECEKLWLECDKNNLKIKTNKPRRDVPHPLLVLVLYPRRIAFRFQLEIQLKLLENY